MAALAATLLATIALGQTPPKTQSAGTRGVSSAQINALLCDSDGWRFDARYVSIASQTSHVHGGGAGLLFTHTRRNEDLWNADREFVNQAYRPRAEKSFGPVDLSSYNELSFWVYVEGNVEEIVKIGFREADFRVSLPRGEWFHARWHFAEDATLDLEAIHCIRLWGVNQGSPPGDPQEARIYLSDFRLSQAHPGHLVGWVPDPGEIILPYCGVYPNEQFTALVAAEHAGKEWRCRAPDNSHSGRVSQALRSRRTDYAEISLQAPPAAGRYVLSVPSGPTTTFTVANYPYDDALRAVLSATRAQRCGCRSVLHGPCHVDDAVRADTDEHVDLAGGWHDEGVFQSYYATLHTARELARFRRSHGRRYALGLNDGEQDDLVAEVEWGTRSILKYDIEPGVIAYTPVKPFWFYTDNRTGTADDRRFEVHRIHQFDIGWRVEALALCAQVCREPLKSRAREAAERLWERSQDVAKYFTAEEQARWQRDSSQIRVVAAGLAANVEMFRLTRERKYAAAAACAADRLLTFQEEERSESDGLYGFFRESPDGFKPYNGPRGKGKDVPGRHLADLLRTLPDHVSAPRWRSALSRYAEGTLKPMAKLNAPYGYLAAGPFADPITTMPDVTMAEKHHDLLVYPIRFIVRPGSRNKEVVTAGETQSLLNAAKQLAAVGRALGDNELLSMAHNAVRYLLGANPFHLSYMRHFGERWPEQAQLPNIGGMMFCILGFTYDGRPYFNPRGSCNTRGRPPFYVQKEGTTLTGVSMMGVCAYFE